jgi:GNAT superfamily N-acetyltransferase
VKPMTIDIREVAFGSDGYHALLSVRDRVLRRPIGWVLRDKDVANDAQERHFGAFDGETAIGCALLKPEGEGVAQLRQVAVEDGYKNMGIGAALIGAVEAAARAAGTLRLETRARRTARRLYERLGYAAMPGGFEDEHTVMMSRTL